MKKTFTIESIVCIARAAGDAIMQIYNSGNAGVTSKADDSPLTLADLAAHKAIITGLGALIPAYPILSEEAADIEYEERRAWSRYWLVDPLDGTKEFIKRNGEFTVNIALIENGVPIMGVVYAPILDVCYFAARGLGAFMQRDQANAKAIQAIASSPQQTVKSCRQSFTQ